MSPSSSSPHQYPIVHSYTRAQNREENGWTYSSLTEALHHRTIILRVHIPGLAEGSQVSGRSQAMKNGFTARDPSFKGLTEDQYHVATSSLRTRDKWAEGPYMRDVIIDHINGVYRRHRQNGPGPGRRWTRGRGHVYGRGSGYKNWKGNPNPVGYGQGIQFGGLNRFHHPQSTPTPTPILPPLPRIDARLRETDEQTPWISTTANLDWAIWYISKLLSPPYPGRNQNQNQTEEIKVNLAVISISTDRKINKELYVAPFLFRSDNEWKELSIEEKDKWKRAKKRAVMAKEVLFYGRVFESSVIADLTFTREKLPFALPSVYYNPPSMINTSLPPTWWLSRLRWDPRLLNYEMAQQSRLNMLGPKSVWNQQPVDSNLQDLGFAESEVGKGVKPRSSDPDRDRVEEVEVGVRTKREEVENEVEVKILEGVLIDLTI